MIDWAEVWDDYLGVSLSGALGIVIATVVIYLFFSLLLHVAGMRLRAAPSTTSFVVLAVVGGVSARSMLGEAPTMLGALVALNTLMVMEALLGTLRRTARHLPRGVQRLAEVVMVDGTAVDDALHRRRLRREDLLERLRAQGVCELEDVALVILENSGSLTVLRRGQRIDRELLSGVRGAEGVPEHLVAP